MPWPGAARRECELDGAAAQAEPAAAVGNGAARGPRHSAPPSGTAHGAAGVERPAAGRAGVYRLQASLSDAHK